MKNNQSTDTVLYDGQCRFCINQIVILKRLDFNCRLNFLSLHDPDLIHLFPNIPTSNLEMYVVDSKGKVYAGAYAVRYLSRQIVALWPLAFILHLPLTMPIWTRIYAFIARHRLKIAGSCANGSCSYKPVNKNN